jgi:hypothetical protein
MLKFLCADTYLGLLAKEQAPSFSRGPFIYFKQAKVKGIFYQINMKYVKLETLTVDI